MIDCDVKAKRAQEQIFKLLRNKLYGVQGEGPSEPEPVSSAGEHDLRGLQANSVTNSSNKGTEEGSSGGVGCCWLCETSKPPFVDHRLQLLYAVSGDYPALPLVENPASAAARKRRNGSAAAMMLDGVIHVGKVITNSHVEADPLPQQQQHMRSFSSSGAAEVKCVTAAARGGLSAEIDPSKSSSSSSSVKKSESASNAAQKGTESAEKGFMSSLVSYFYASSGSMSTTTATSNPPKSAAASAVAGQTKGTPSGQGLAVGTVVKSAGTPCVTSERAAGSAPTGMANTTAVSGGTKPPDFIEVSYIAPTKAARLNRKMRKALAEWDVIDDLISHSPSNGGTGTSPKNTTSHKSSTSAGSSSFSPHLGPNAPSPPLDVTRMLLCLSCFKLCYDGFSRPELVTDREAMEKRASLSNRIHKLADVLRFGGSGGDEAHHGSEKETEVGGAVGTAKHKNNAHPLSLASSASKRKSQNRRIASEKPNDADTDNPNIDGNACTGGEENMSDSGSDTDNCKDFVDLGGSGYDIFINTHGNFLLAEAILGESYDNVEASGKNATIQLKSLDDSVESRSSVLKSVSSPVVFGARGVSAFSTPPRQDSISIANTTVGSNSVSGRHPAGVQPDVEREPAQTHHVASAARHAPGGDKKKTIPCSYCGEELHDQRGHSSADSHGVSYCIAFHPNPYFHRIWNCPSCTALMTVALPQCLVCRTDAPYYNESAMMAALNSDANTNSKTDPTGEAGGAGAGGQTATQALDELLLNIGATRQTQIGDGNCLFRSLAHQLFGNQDCHMLVREMCCDYIEEHREDYEMLVVGMGLGATQPKPPSFSNRVSESTTKSDTTHDHEGNELIALLSAREDLIFPQYVSRMRMSGTWGDELCVHAAARLFTVRIHVLTSDFPSSRWHLVFDPNPEDREERRGSRREGSLANTVNSKNNRKTCTDTNVYKEGNASEISRLVRHEYDDCSPKTDKTDENERQPIGLSKSSHSGANKHLPSTKIADIFLLYLRPFHYDDIVSPPMLRSVMEKLSETLQLELAEEEGWL